MEKYVIEGGHRLEGEISVVGAKNAILGIIPAAILAKGTTVIENVPHIKDVNIILEILEAIGAKVTFQENTLIIDSTEIHGSDLREFDEKFRDLRASYYLWGALIGRNGGTISSLPGGCNIGSRQIGLHLKGFKALGVEVCSKAPYMSFHVPDKLKGNYIYLDVASVGATINIMLAAVLAEGVTTIENAAKEPHVVDVANFLTRMGANIKGAGTEKIKIKGVEELHPCSYEVIPDQIVAGTYMIAAAVTEGDVTITDVIPKHLESLTSKMREMGAEIEIHSQSVRVRGKRPYHAIEVRTNCYPGFPTDLQQPLAVMMMLADGESRIEENLFNNRFGYISELERMGADAQLFDNDNVCLINGVSKLTGSTIRAVDLRAGAAMVLAGLCADGETEITDIDIIDRGYENLEERLSELGAVIRRIE